MELYKGCVIRNRFTGDVLVVGNVFTETTTGIKYVLFWYIDADKSIMPLYISEFANISRDWQKVYV